VTGPAPLPGAWNDLDGILAAGVSTLPQLLAHQAERYRERVLHRKKEYGIWQRHTWGEVLGEVRAFAMGLAALGIRRGETVAIVGENEPELFWSQYAAQAIGAKVACLYPDLTAAQMEYMLQQVNVPASKRPGVLGSLDVAPDLPVWMFSLGYDIPF
jgi:long-chain acyl-CoA synthetase